MDDEAALGYAMKRLADGDRSAFDELYVALYPRAVSLARRRMREESQVEDVAQRALMRVFSRAREFREGAPVLPWFYAIAANEVRAVARDGGVVAARAEDERALAQVADAARTPEANMIAKELRAALAAAVAALDPEAAEAIAAALGEGEKPQVSPATFRKRVSRAYEKLRALVGGFDAG